MNNGREGCRRGEIQWKKGVREGMDVLKGYRSESAHIQARKGKKYENESSKCER